MTHSNRNNGRGNAAATEMILPGIELFKQHKREVGFKSVRLFGWGFLILAVSALLSMVTAGVLTRMMPEALAYVLAGVLHCTLALSTHLLFVGIAQRKKTEKVVGSIFLAVCLATMTWLFITRAGVMIEEGRPAGSAWAMSFFLLLMEVTIPVVMGYVMGVLDVARRKANDELVYFRKLKGRLESRENPRDVWPDAISSLTKVLESRETKMETVRPEEVATLQEEIDVLETRLDEVKEWDPTHSYQRRQREAIAPQFLMPSEDGTPISIAIQRSQHASEREAERVTMPVEHTNGFKEGAKVRW